MTEIWYDTEFLEDGRTIELISIGMVRADGRELYLINEEMDPDTIAGHDWLRANVLPFLPAKESGAENLGVWWEWDEAHPDYGRLSTWREIRDAVRRFVLEVEDPQLWAWFGAYDHVVLAQLFGRMIDLPTGFPMWSNDVRQLSQEMGNPVLPVQDPAEAHNALADARWTREAYWRLRGIQGQVRPVPALVDD